MKNLSKALLIMVILSLIILSPQTRISKDSEEFVFPKIVVSQSIDTKSPINITVNSKTISIDSVFVYIDGKYYMNFTPDEQWFTVNWAIDHALPVGEHDITVDVQLKNKTVHGFTGNLIVNPTT